MPRISKFPPPCPRVALGLVLVGSIAMGQSIVVAADDFSTPSLNTTTWTTITAGIPGASVTQANGVLTLANKGYLRSNEQVSPPASGAVRVTGKWRFQTANPEAGVLAVQTRTDAVPSGFYYESLNALEFNLWLGPSFSGGVSIFPRGSQVQVGALAITGSLTWSAGAWFEFEALDGINHASWTVREVGVPSNSIHATCTLSTTRSPINYVAIHGREHIGGDNICDLDEFRIEVADCNGNQVADGIDIGSGTSADCDGNLTPDDCEIAAHPEYDLNVNGVLDSCECVSSVYCVGAPNSVGSGARIGYAGTLSVGSNNLSLVCTGLPPSSSGLFYYGSAQTQVPFGNGYRCVGGSTFRTPITVAGPSGLASRNVNYGALPPAGQITVGSTWNFQYWYRNPAAGGAGFNLSDGLHATFCP